MTVIWQLSQENESLRALLSTEIIGELYRLPKKDLLAILVTYPRTMLYEDPAPTTRFIC